MLTEKFLELFREFNLQFPCEEECISFVRDCLAEQGRLLCHSCQGRQVEHLDSRTIRCVDCGKTTWFTAGTFFDHTKKLRPFLALIWFYEHNLPLNSSKARDLLGIAQSSAWVMLKKIALAFLPRLDDQESQTGLLPCAVFVDAIRKRSKESPAKQHHCDEVLAPNAPQNIREDASSAGVPEDSQAGHSLTLPESIADNLAPPQRRLLQILVEENTSLHVEKLSALTGIPLSEIHLHLLNLTFEKLIIPESAGGYSANRRHLAHLSVHFSSEGLVDPSTVKTYITQFVTYCHTFFHGISRKYVQLYSCQFARLTCALPPNMGNVVKSILLLPRVIHRDIQNYSSPALIKLPVS